MRGPQRIGLAAAICLAAPTAAQAPRYHAPEDTVHHRTVNPYLLYWITGKDTVGTPAHALSVESRAWSEDGSGLDVRVSERSLDPNRTEQRHHFRLTPQGRVVAIDGAPPGLRAQIDFVPRLPDVPLRPGASWVDTAGSGGDDHYAFRIVRTYRVVREADTLDARAVLLSAEGRVWYRDAWQEGGWAGRWLDVSGPITETVWFDAEAGQVLSREWSMDLRGRGGLSGAPGDTVAAGLRSASRERRISRDHARLLGRDLPGRDTSYTAAGGSLLFLHTTGLRGDTLASGMVRWDGLVGTAETVFADGRPVAYEAVWTDSAAAVVRHRLVSREGVLHVSRTGAADTILTPPAELWGIADFAMGEHLGPLLASLPFGDTGRRIAIYRPYAGRWQMGTIRTRKAGEGVLAVLQMDDEAEPTALVFNPSGGILYGENSGPRGARRIFPPATVPGAMARRILESLNPD